MRTRRQFSREFKREAARLVKDRGVSVAQARARAIAGTGRRWYGRHHPRTLAKQALVVGQRRLVAHLFEVMPGAEGAAGCGDDDGACASVSRRAR